MCLSLFNLSLLNESEGFTGLGLHSGMIQHTQQSQEKSTLAEPPDKTSCSGNCKSADQGPGPLVLGSIQHLPRRSRVKPRRASQASLQQCYQLELGRPQRCGCHSDISKRLSPHKGAETRSSEMWWLTDPGS